MTQRAGAFQAGGPVNGFNSALRSMRAGFLIQATSAVPNLLKFKNQGWYAAGGVYETWTSVGSPSVTPPSGHTLVGLSFVIFEDTATV